MNGDFSERIARYLGADEYDDLSKWWKDNKYKKKRRAWFAGTCLFLSLFIILIANCGGPDAGDPDNGPPSTLTE